MIESFRALRFRPTPVPTIAALLAVTLTGYLGHWQQTRATEKHAMQQQFNARAAQPPISLDEHSRDALLRYRNAIAEGEWYSEGQIYVDNQVSHGKAGFNVVTPLKLLDGKTYVLINRGWIERGATYPNPPAAPVTGHATVAGRLSVPSTRFLELSNQSIQGNVWQNLTIERYRSALKLDVLPWVLISKDAEFPLESVAERSDAGEDKHLEYMLTWYSLAVTVVILWLVLNIGRGIADHSDLTASHAAAKPVERTGDA
jgi:surfeit locus 1 family protein